MAMILRWVLVQWLRLIEKEIRKPLADELLFGQLSEGGTVKVGVNKDKIALTIS